MLNTDPEALMAWQLRFNFDTDAPRIFAVTPPFKTSGWQDVGMRSPNLSAFRARGGRMIVPHGVSDPVFSVNDTIAWWREVDQLNKGKAADFVRVFPVPGMNHCSGGPATDRFDSLTALEQWVDKGIAPASIPTEAGPDTPWLGRKRPLCPYPRIAREIDGQFICQ
jgi:feruloyl esterase